MSEMFWKKVNKVVAESVALLDPADRAERIEHCQRTGEHGVTAQHEGDWIRFDWGGRTLAAVPREILADDTAELPAGQHIPEVPDAPPWPL